MKLSVYGQWYGHSTDLALVIPYHGQYVSYSLWLYCYSCIYNSMVHIPTYMEEHLYCTINLRVSVLPILA